MTTFTQLNASFKNFLSGWFLVLGLKECQVECATLCVKSEVILTSHTFRSNAKILKMPEGNLFKNWLRSSWVAGLVILTRFPVSGFNSTRLSLGFGSTVALCSIFCNHSGAVRSSFSKLSFSELVSLISSTKSFPDCCSNSYLVLRR